MPHSFWASGEVISGMWQRLHGDRVRDPQQAPAWFLTDRTARRRLHVQCVDAGRSQLRPPALEYNGVRSANPIAAGAWQPGVGRTDTAKALRASNRGSVGAKRAIDRVAARPPRVNHLS